MASRNSSRLVFFLRLEYSISENVNWFISTWPFSWYLYYIKNHEEMHELISVFLEKLHKNTWIIRHKTWSWEYSPCEWEWLSRYELFFTKMLCLTTRLVWKGFISSDTLSSIWNTLNSRLSNVCSTNACFLYSFRTSEFPIKPKNTLHHSK